MKPIFCINVTDDKDHEVVNGEEFIIQRVPKEMINALDTAQEKLQDTIDQTKLPLPIRIIKGVAGALALIAIWIFSLSLEDGETFKDALERSQIIVGIALLCGLV